MRQHWYCCGRPLHESDLHLCLKPPEDVTDDGLVLFGEQTSYAAIAEEIERVPGVVAHGLCVGLAAAAVVAEPGAAPRVLVPSAAAAQ